jgi:4-alpha-glucanotransferase
VGDLADLGALAEWAAREHGADFVLINPLHAAEVVAPMNPSPYLPTSRRLVNPMYLRVEDIPEFGRLTRDERARVDVLREHATVESELIDRDRSWNAKREALELVHAARRDHERTRAFTRFRAAAGDELERFATWCAVCELHGNDWRKWPEPLRDPASPDVAAAVSDERVEFHCWLQWLLEEQLAAAQDRALGAGMRLGIVHDLAVGVSPAGADAWSWQQAMATAVRVGAPPDAYSQKGQDWQQPPWRPDALARLGFAPLRDLFRAALRHGGGVRIDHIIGLFRLWWIPDGVEADAGTYVHYDADALIGILALEAQRAGAVIIGEDLGNVQPEVHRVMHERGLLGTSILWFELDRSANVPLPPQRWRADCLASVTTHDLPPSAGYLEGDHIRLRERLGLLTRPVADEYADAARERAAWVDALSRLELLGPGDPSDDDIVRAVHEFLALTPSSMRCVALTDAVGERRTQNQPGTADEYPNWRIPLGDTYGRPVRLEDLPTNPHVTRILATMRR